MFEPENPEDGVFRVPVMGTEKMLEIPVAESSFTDPDKKVEPVKMPSEKPSFFKRVFGR